MKMDTSTHAIISASSKEFMASLKKMQREHYPEMVVEIFAELAADGLAVARERVRAKYSLHTDWIPRNFNAIPVTPAQQAAAKKAVASYGDFFAAVYLKGSVDPKYSLGFMAEHEEGTTRKPRKKAIAQPAKDYDEKAAKNARGKTRKSMRPAEMLARFTAAKSEYDEAKKTTITRSFPSRRARIKRGLRREVGNWFLIMGKGGVPMIVRRNPKKGVRSTERAGKKIRRFGLEFAYAMDKSQSITATFEFIDTVYREITARIRQRALKADMHLPRKVTP